MSPGDPADQVFVASTAFGLATLVAAIQDGLYPRPGRRVLITSNNATVPETSPEINEVVGSGLYEPFDDVYSYNAVIAPQHPSEWQPRAADLLIWERHLRQCWDLSRRRLQLVVESIEAPPSLVLARTFADARIDVYGDGLTSYAPTRIALPRTVAARIERLLHLDLVPGARPLLLSELGVPSVLISDQAFTDVVHTIDTGPVLAPSTAGGTAILLGQDLVSDEVLSEQEEVDLHRSLVRGAVEAGFQHVVLTLRPAAPTAMAGELHAEAKRLGAGLVVVREPTLVERWFSDPQVGLVAGCFSTALMIAQSLYGLPTAQTGTDLVLRRLRPYANRNRVSAALVQLGVPALDRVNLSVARSTAQPTTGRLVSGLHVLGFAMQPEHYPHLRPAAEEALRREPGLTHLVGQARLRELELPGARRQHPVKAAAQRMVGARTYGQLRRLTRHLRAGGHRA